MAPRESVCFFGCSFLHNISMDEVSKDLLKKIMGGIGRQVILKKTVALAASGTIHTPASGKKLRVYNLKFSLSADMTDVAMKFGSNSAFEKFLAPKSGGLYGTNLHPNYTEGEIDEALKCDITGTGTVQINLDYIEV